MMNLLRRIASLPGLRAVLLRPRVRSMIASVLALRFLRVAGLTATPVRFVVADLLTSRHRLRTWRLRDGGEVTLMHRRDTEAFHEIHLAGEYEPPGELAERLADVARIVDVGGNIGLFSAWACQRWPAAHLTSLEPDPDNLVAFQAWLSRDPGARARVELIPAAAGTAAGRMGLVSGVGSGASFGPVAEGGVPAVDLFDHLAGADLIKIDIEGGEWPILSDPRMAQLDDVVLVMEYHRRGAPSLPAREAAEGLLARAGFATGHVRPNHWGHGVLWAWRPRSSST